MSKTVITIWTIFVKNSPNRCITIDRPISPNFLKTPRFKSIARSWALFWRPLQEKEQYVILKFQSSWLCHPMETFSALLALCEGNHRPPLDSPHKGQRRGALMFSLICAWTNGWANNRDACDLMRHRAHYDVIIMTRQCDSTIDHVVGREDGKDMGRWSPPIDN